MRESFLSLILFLSWFALFWVGLREERIVQPRDWGSISTSDLQCDLKQVLPQSCVSDSLPRLLRRFSFPRVIACEFSSFLGRTGSPSLMRPRPDTAVPPFGLRPHTIHPSPGVEELAGGSWHSWGTGVWDGLGSVQLCQEYGCCRKKAARDGSTKALGPADFTHSVWHRLERGIFNDRVWKC